MTAATGGRLAVTIPDGGDAWHGFWLKNDSRIPVGGTGGGTGGTGGAGAAGGGR